MNHFSIVTDSTADLSDEQVKKYNIRVVPISINFGSESYADGVDISAEEFYSRLTTVSELPKTSQPSPEAFKRLYEELTGENNTILSIHVSSNLSGTINSAELASKEISGRVIIVDTKNASQGIGLSVLVAGEAAKKGLSVEETLAVLEKSVAKTFSVFSVDTLEYLHRNGRIGKAASLLGSLLQIRPILFADPEGMVAPYDKVRGRSKIIPALVNAALENVSADEPVNLSIVHSGSEESARELQSRLQEEYDIKNLHLGMVGPAIGANIGPGAIGLMIQPSFDTLLKT